TARYRRRTRCQRATRLTPAWELTVLVMCAQRLAHVNPSQRAQNPIHGENARLAKAVHFDDHVRAGLASAVGHVDDFSLEDLSVMKLVKDCHRLWQMDVADEEPDAASFERVVGGGHVRIDPDCACSDGKSDSIRDLPRDRIRNTMPRHLFCGSGPCPRCRPSRGARWHARSGRAWTFRNHHADRVRGGCSRPG